jgi:hypothetical protein
VLYFLVEEVLDLFPVFVLPCGPFLRVFSILLGLSFFCYLFVLSFVARQ